MKAMLGRKIGMSQTFSPQGELVPVTVIHAEPNTVTLSRTDSRDGYTAVQLGLPKDAETFAARREFAGELGTDTTTMSVTQFTPGDRVRISGVSKGKGFQGVVKRHHFKGGPASHGHRHVLRRPGSIGSRFPQHVRKGKRMAGRMGGDRVTVFNLEVVSIDADQHLLIVKGAVPGKRGTVLEIETME